MSSRSRTRGVMGVVALAGAIGLLRPGTRAHKAARHGLRVARRRLRYLGGQLQGAAYRHRGGAPDPDVADDVLADRIRSSLGPLEKRLDLPHVHVMVEDHVALLHGEVGTTADAQQIVSAVEAVSGVAAVESYLHVGLLRSDNRPSDGRVAYHPSDGRRRLQEAATAAGVGAGAATQVVRAVLANFADRLPASERDHVSAHLPEDVRSLFRPPWRTPSGPAPRTVTQLVSRVGAEASGLSPDQVEAVTAAVIRELRSLVPEEAAGVAAVLPAELRDLWEAPFVG